MKGNVFFIVFFINFVGFAQIDSLQYRQKDFAVQDSIVFHKVSTNPTFFQLFTDKGIQVDKSLYKVDFGHSVLYLQADFYKQFPEVTSIRITYFPYPDFLTKTYYGIDPKRIIPDNPNPIPIQTEPEKKLTKQPLNGLNTQGNLIRGIRVGNNQDAVLNSVLDLQIEGKLTDKVNLRAHINDTNIPIQENGYSQDLKDLDRVYIEMEGPQWLVTAGDLMLNNTDTYFMNFNKKVSGVSLEAQIDSTRFITSGALVRGRFTSYDFKGQEANQGPYKLQGEMGENYIFIINNSEKVYINGLLQTRGRDKDYVIDYNTAEITFNPTKPITSDMRIRVEFQYSDRNYTRFVTYDGVQYKGKKLQIGTYFYRENDVKNDPLQLQLSDEQKELLAQIGNTTEQILVPNIIETPYTENAILYRKILLGTDTIFEYSTDPDETLYQVSFTFVGVQQGDYQVVAYLAQGKKMEYVGNNNGDYVAAVPLVAPSKQQIFMLNSHYTPSDKTDFSIEMAYSDNDRNLFSTISDDTNTAPALKLAWHQQLIDSTAKGWQLQGAIQYDFLHKNFKSIERIFNVEFDRDWNLITTDANQRMLTSELVLSNDKTKFSYGFDNLNFNNLYNGNRHKMTAVLQADKWQFTQATSYLKSEGNVLKTAYLQSKSDILYKNNSWWMGTTFDYEDNRQKDIDTENLDIKSYLFSDFQGRIGVGDSAKVFVELGVAFHANDSVKLADLERVNTANTWFVNSSLLNTDKAKLKVYANYRKVHYNFGEDKEALNSRILYNQQLFNQFVNLQTHYQNISGNIAQQEYTYIETDTGNGYYTWNDYNGDGVQDLDEFQIAQFADEANYLRIALPNIQYIPTQEARLQQSIQLNLSKWAQEKGFKKALSHWYNSTAIMATNNKLHTSNTLHLNPFDFTGQEVVAMQYNFRNSLFYNRGKAQYTTAYHYTNSRQKTVRIFDSQENELESHQLDFQHTIKENWQLGLQATSSFTKSTNSTFDSRNYKIIQQSFIPNIKYIVGKNHWIKLNYTYNQKENTMGDKELLTKQEIGLKYKYIHKETNHFMLAVNVLKNDFTGNSFSVVGYQMLEGLQVGNNMTWELLWSKKLNSFLYLNLNYNARANTISKTIHNGSVELRANF